MSRKQLTAVIEGSQEIKIGEQVLLAVDFTERNAQSFTISSCTLEIYDNDGSVVLSTDSGSVTTGLSGAQRVQHTLTAAETAAFTDGPHSVLWTLTLSDMQTRKVRQSLDVVTP